MQTKIKPDFTAPIITPATKNNTADIIALARRIWPMAYADVLTPEQIENMLQVIYSPENLLQEMTDGHRFWLASYDNSYAGYVSAYKDANTIWIKKIYVDQAVKGRGIGKTLIDQAILNFLPAKNISLLVNAKNVAAHRFYEHNGFVKIGEKPVRMGDWHFNDFIYSKPVTEIQ